jgi:hypothetical protein
LVFGLGHSKGNHNVNREKVKEISKTAFAVKNNKKMLSRLRIHLSENDILTWKGL